MVEHKCNYQEIIIENVKSIASIQENIKNNSEKLDRLEGKIDNIVNKISGFIKVTAKVAIAFILLIVTNFSWSAVASLF